MKKKIILQAICGFILHQLIVSANVVPQVSNPVEKLTVIESVDNNNLLDDVNVKNLNKSCDVVLNFSNMGFKHIRSQFITSLYVKNLTLRDNSITEFEKGAFDGLPNLEHLDASRNQLSLTELFSFGGHSNLKTLVLDYNCLFSLCLPSVNDPDLLVYDPLKRTIRSPRRQYYFDDDDDYLYFRPSTTTTTIRTTTKSPEEYRRRLKINPSYYFPELEILSLRKINIDSLSAEWSFNFPKLKYLDLSENRFYEPAINVYNNIPPTTSYLIMESADLTATRSQQFKNITVLNLSNNYFNKISNGVYGSSILSLLSLYNLQTLSASNCSITEIDTDAFDDTKSLLQLNLSNNQIVDLPIKIFYSIPSLLNLDLSKNNLNKMPDFGVLKNLSTLELDDMQNVTIFDSLGSFPFMPNLTMISLRKNNLKVIPQTFLENLPALREIDLSYNQITSLPPFMSQIFLSKLYLSFNRISNIDDLSLNDAKSLVILDLNSNPIFGLKVGSLRMLPLNAFIQLRK